MGMACVAGDAEAGAAEAAGAAAAADAKEREGIVVVIMPLLVVAILGTRSRRGVKFCWAQSV